MYTACSSSASRSPPLGWIGVVAYLVLVRFVVLVEEEHLTRLFGQPYRDYCILVPRFVGRRRRAGGDSPIRRSL